MIGGIIIWIILAFVIGLLGNNRRIGFAGSFFLSLLLSPLIGLIITLCSKDKEDEAYKAQVLETQKQQQETLKKVQDTVAVGTVTNELERLKKLKDDGVLSDDEFNTLKKKALEGIGNTMKEKPFPFEITTHLNNPIQYQENKEEEGHCYNFNISFSDGKRGVVYQNTGYKGFAILDIPNKNFYYYITKEAAIKALYYYLTENGKILDENKI